MIVQETSQSQSISDEHLQMHIGNELGVKMHNDAGKL